MCLRCEFDLKKKKKLTAVVHSVQSQQIQRAEVIVLAESFGELWVLRRDGGVTRVYIEGVRSIVHNRLVIIGGVLISYERVIIFIEVVLHTCNKTFILKPGLICNMTNTSLPLFFFLFLTAILSD